MLLIATLLLLRNTIANWGGASNLVGLAAMHNWADDFVGCVSHEVQFSATKERCGHSSGMAPFTCTSEGNVQVSCNSHSGILHVFGSAFNNSKQSCFPGGECPVRECHTTPLVCAHVAHFSHGTRRLDHPGGDGIFCSYSVRRKNTRFRRFPATLPLVASPQRGEGWGCPGNTTCCLQHSLSYGHCSPSQAYMYIYIVRIIFSGIRRPGTLPEFSGRPPRERPWLDDDDDPSSSSRRR